MCTHRLLAICTLQAPIMAVDVTAARSAQAQHFLLRQTCQPGSARHISCLCAPACVYWTRHWAPARRGVRLRRHGQASVHLGARTSARFCLRRRSAVDSCSVATSPPYSSRPVARRPCATPRRPLRIHAGCRGRRRGAVGPANAACRPAAAPQREAHASALSSLQGAGGRSAGANII